MATLRITGKVDKQVAPGEVVTVSIIEPDGGTQITAHTDAGGNYSAVTGGITPGNCTVKAVIAEDSANQAASSDTQNIVVPDAPPKEARTLTLNVEVV